MPPVDRQHIAAVHERIGARLRTTPVVRVAGADFDVPGVQLVFKLELLQHSGSFKARGAFANLLGRELPPAGVIAASGGNHGAAVSYAARELGVAATIFIPSVSPAAKVDRIRGYGAELVIAGDLFADALAASEERAATSGALPVHAFDQEETMLGQGTLARELEGQAPELDSLLVAVGGGGLIGGIAAWYGGAVDVVGVEPETAPTLTRALAAGRPVDAEAGGIAADSLAPRRVGEAVFPIVRQHVHQVVLVPDEAIRRAQLLLWDRLRVVAEPGGATALAALLTGRYQPRAGERIGVLVSGGNTDAVRFPPLPE